MNKNMEKIVELSDCEWTQNHIWKSKKIKKGNCFWVKEFYKYEYFIFPCDAVIYYEKEDKCWYVNGSLGKAICGRSEIANSLLVEGFGKDVELFSCWTENFYKYDDGELNFIWLPIGFNPESGRLQIADLIIELNQIHPSKMDNFWDISERLYKLWGLIVK